MQLNITTDYAIRVILFLAMKKRIVSSVELSEKMRIPHSCVLKVTGKLVKSKLIKTHVGKQGGYCIEKKPDEITLLKILEIMEPTMKFNRCLEEDRLCSRGGVGKCSMHDFYKEFQREMEAKLSSITIKDFIDGNRSAKMKKEGKHETI